MGATTTAIEAIIQQIKSWPADQRIALARRIFETLECGAIHPVASTKGRSADEVRGMWNRGGRAPSDEECEQILAEELQKKYGP